VRIVKADPSAGCKTTAAAFFEWVSATRPGPRTDGDCGFVSGYLTFEQSWDDSLVNARTSCWLF